MATQHYRFQARNERGELTSGVLQAESVAEAAQLLRARGDHVVQLVPLAAAGEDFKAVLKKLNYSSVWLGAAAAGLVLVLAGGLVIRSATTDDTPSSAESSTSPRSSR